MCDAHKKYCGCGNLWHNVVVVAVAVAVVLDNNHNCRNAVLLRIVSGPSMKMIVSLCVHICVDVLCYWSMCVCEYSSFPCMRLHIKVMYTQTKATNVCTRSRFVGY